MKIPRGRMMLTACRIRMARAALRWNIEELARRAGVGQKTIRRIEKVESGFRLETALDSFVCRVFGRRTGTRFA